MAKAPKRCAIWVVACLGGRGGHGDKVGAQVLHSTKEAQQDNRILVFLLR